jgi:hypothetical protein
MTVNCDLEEAVADTFEEATTTASITSGLTIIRTRGTVVSERKCFRCPLFARPPETHDSERLP